MSAKFDQRRLISYSRTASDLSVIKIAALVLVALWLGASLPTAASAYVGPGAGITAIGALWALIATVFITLGGLLVWPIRAFLRRRKLTVEKDDEAVSGAAEGTGDK